MPIVEIDPSKLDSRDYLRELSLDIERGQILLVRDTPFHPSPDDSEFLRNSKQSSAKTHKNIAYKPEKGQVTGAAEHDSRRLNEIMENYSKGSLEYLTRLFPFYAPQWHVDYASFRPFEEQNRDLPLSRRNDLMHVDAFPTRPTHGGRILRAFTNLHPSRGREWLIAEPFEKLAERYADDAGLNTVKSFGSSMKRAAGKLTRSIGIKSPDRSPYDEFMLGFHHYLKANKDFQDNGIHEVLEFPPGSTWICFTDHIAHAVRTGQYALEQTCIVPLKAMLEPAIAPVAVLEKLAGGSLIPDSSRPD